MAKVYPINITPSPKGIDNLQYPLHSICNCSGHIILVCLGRCHHTPRWRDSSHSLDCVHYIASAFIEPRGDALLYVTSRLIQTLSWQWGVHCSSKETGLPLAAMVDWQTWNSGLFWSLSCFLVNLGKHLIHKGPVQRWTAANSTSAWCRGISLSGTIQDFLKGAPGNSSLLISAGKIFSWDHMFDLSHWAKFLYSYRDFPIDSL